MKILIAEDDAASRKVLSILLRKRGLEVIETENGQQAWQIMQQPDAPRMVIIDWRMQGMDGLELIRRIRSLRSGAVMPYIMMVTSMTGKGDIVRALKAQANDYLTKPFDSNELNARIEVGLRMIGMQEELEAKVNELERVLAEINTIKELVPVCSSCKKIRDDEGYWQQIEKYISTHTGLQFSHSICPECAKKLYPWMDTGEEDEKEIAV